MAGDEPWRRARHALTNLRATVSTDRANVEARAQALELYDLLDRNADAPELAEAADEGWRLLAGAEATPATDAWLAQLAPWLER